MGEWRNFRLGDVSTKIGSGATPRGGSGVYIDHGPYSLIRSQNVFNEGFHTDGLASIGEVHAKELKNVEVLKDDILLNITGASVARCCQVDYRVLPARVNQHVSIIRPDPGRLDPQFLRYLLISPKTQSYLLALAGAGATREALTKEMIGSLKVFAPANIDEQCAIAHILGTLDDKIELNRRMNETLEAMARAIFKSWFVDFDSVRAKAASRDPGLSKPIADLFPDSFEDSELGEVPAGWKIKLMSDVIDVNPPRSLRKGDLAPYLEMKQMPTSAMRAQEVFDRKYSSGMRFINGDTLIARITPCLENGKTCFVDFLSEEEVGWGSTEYIVLRPKPPLPLNYVYFLARTAWFRKFAISNMTGTSGRQRVPASSFNQLRLVVPTSEIAQLFGTLIEPMVSMMKVNDEESRTLAALRDTLLPKLISGELRVKESMQFSEPLAL